HTRFSRDWSSDVCSSDLERVAPADLGLQQRADLLQELVARAVPARVVDDLELVEVDVEHRVGRLSRLGALQRALEAALELAAVRSEERRVGVGSGWGGGT